MLITSDLYKQVIGDTSEWGYVPLTSPVVSKINRILNKESIQESFHESVRAYEALKRWDLFRHFRTHIPKRIEPVRNASYCVPAQLDGSDWRFINGHQGRWPRYWDYCCAHACHWMSVPWLKVANLLFPQHRWEILSHRLHTGIVCIDQKLIFDPYFYTVNVPVSETMNLWFNFEDEEDYFDLCELCSEYNPYSYETLEGTSHHAQRFWKLADSWSGEPSDLVQTLNKFLDEHELDEGIDSETNLGLTDNSHLNQDPEALLVLACREDQY